jgi:F-type H+-transporting ATPase subunit b
MASLRTVALPIFAWAAASPLTAMAAESDDASSGGMPQLDVHWWPSQVFWLAICFLISYVLSSRLLLPAIGGTLETRRQKITGDVSMAGQLKAEAEAAHAAYEAGLASARAESTAIVNSIHDRLKARAEHEGKAFRASLEQQSAALEQRLAKAKAEAMNDMTSIAADIASEAARKIVGVSFDKQQAQTVIEALNRREAA